MAHSYFAFIFISGDSRLGAALMGCLQQINGKVTTAHHTHRSQDGTTESVQSHDHRFHGAGRHGLCMISASPVRNAILIRMFHESIIMTGSRDRRNKSHFFTNAAGVMADP
jgi:hypothetical protein